MRLRQSIVSAPIEPPRFYRSAVSSASWGPRPERRQIWYSATSRHDESHL